MSDERLADVVLGYDETFRRMPAQKPGRSKQDYRTQPDLLAAVKRFLDISDFDIDLAATRDFDSMTDNAVTERCYTKQDNALVQPWLVGDGWNWLNPEFSNIRPWVGRAWDQWENHGAKTVVLVPAGVGANWWRDHVHQKACVLFLNGRLQFVGADGLYPKDCAILLYGMQPGYHTWTWRNDVPKAEAA